MIQYIRVLTAFTLAWMPINASSLPHLTSSSYIAPYASSYNAHHIHHTVAYPVSAAAASAAPPATSIQGLALTSNNNKVVCATAPSSASGIGTNFGLIANRPFIVNAPAQIPLAASAAAAPVQFNLGYITHSNAHALTPAQVTFGVPNSFYNW